MNIYRDNARTGVSRAGLGRGCTLMQWFILFGLRASWTSSIIVIHRRKWAARGGAGGGRAPRAVLSRSPTLSPPARESRDASCLRLTHSVAVRVCVPSRCRYRSSWSRVQCPASEQLGVAAPATPAPVLSSWRLSWSPARLQLASARWVRSMTACTRSTPLYVSISSRSQNGWMDRMHASRTEPTASLAKGCDSVEKLRRCSKCRVIGRVDKQCLLTHRTTCYELGPWKHWMVSGSLGSINECEWIVMYAGSACGCKVLSSPRGFPSASWHPVGSATRRAGCTVAQNL